MKKTLSILSLIGIGATIYGGCCPGGSCPPKTPSTIKQSPKPKTTKEVIQNAYGAVAENGGVCELFGGGCCGGGEELSKMIGYSKEELDAVAGANLGLGCGNPISLGDMPEGAVILDLGSGAGLDCLLAAKRVGPAGRVIGVDMTDAMLNKARENAKKYGFKNVEFRKGDIEALPVDSVSVDIVISNCVINLAPDKLQVFKEAHRVLKRGGKMYVSDVVLLDHLTPAQQKDEKLLCACVAGAILRTDYIAQLEQAGFEVNVVGEDFEIGKKWFSDESLPISSLKFVAIKK
jgi:ArsR family transcriptional regulator